MSPLGAFGEEMGNVELTFEDADRLLSGDSAADADPSDAFAELASLMEWARDGLREEIVENTVLVQQLARVALESRNEAEEAAARDRRAAAPRRRSRAGLLARMGVAVGALVISTAGLAMAGVDVTAPPSSVLEGLGITHPDNSDNKPDKANKNADDPPPPDATSKGNSSAAHQRVLERRASRPPKGKAIGHTRGRAVGLRGTTPPGRDGVPNTPPAHSNAGGGGTGKSQGSTHSQAPSTAGGGSSSGDAGKANGKSDGRGKNG